MEEKKETIFRVCSYCGNSKPLNEFYIDQRFESARRSICKKCHAINGKKRYALNREHILEHQRRYYHEHKEQIRAQKRKYECVHKRAYYRRHKEQIRARNKKYRRSERGNFFARQHNSRRRARQKASKVDLTSDQWQRILENQKHRCNICGKRFCETRGATVDHIIPLAEGGDLTSCNVQALCRSCNSSKGAKIMNCFINSWCLLINHAK